jgi:hypothetical protein
MEHADAPGTKKPDRSNRLFGEARPVAGHSLSPTPYRAPWFASAAWGALLCVVYPLLILTPVAMFAVLSPHSHRAPAVAMGVNCAVVAFAILALQFVIAARLRWLEAPFGLDVLRPLVRRESRAPEANANSRPGSEHLEVFADGAASS